MSNELPEPPIKVWLQWHGDGDPSDGDPVPTVGVTWSAEKVWRGDVEYVRADEYNRLRDAIIRHENFVRSINPNPCKGDVILHAALDRPN
jgi:hypothetical protein